GLDHLRAELGHQRAAERTGNHLGELEHADAFQRKSGLCHGAGVYLFAANCAIGADSCWRGRGLSRRRVLSYHGSVPIRPPRRGDGRRRRRTSMASTEPGALKTLVDVERGIISREIFVSDEIYRQEQERVFARAWLFIGHESQIPRPGDFLTSCMGEESVILCRDRAGKIRVFLNSCRLGGMKVCRYAEGTTVESQFPYRGWSYATDGALVGVPFAKDAYGAQLDRSRWGLVEVARMENYKGTIWATWDASAPPFAEYIGGYKPYLDLPPQPPDGPEGGAEAVGGGPKKGTPPPQERPPRTRRAATQHR